MPMPSWCSGGFLLSLRLPWLRLTQQQRDNVVEGRQVYFKDPAIGLEMQFAMLVDFAPMAILRSAFRYVGGLDEGMSEPGMCGICKRGGVCSDFLDVR